MSVLQAWKRNAFSASSFASQAVESFFGQYKAAHGEGAGEDSGVDIVAMCFHLNWLEINKERQSQGSDLVYGTLDFRGEQHHEYVLAVRNFASDYIIRQVLVPQLTLSDDYACNPSNEPNSERKLPRGAQAWTTAQL